MKYTLFNHERPSVSEVDRDGRPAGHISQDFFISDILIIIIFNLDFDSIVCIIVFGFA